jgi:hypothetical protein
MRFGLLLGALGTVGTLIATTAPDSRACGGCFHEPVPPTQVATVVTDHRMIFTVSPLQTTLYDEIKYSGAPSSFAWVLPIHGQVTVALSADIVFASLEQATQTTILAPPLPQCPSCPCQNFGGVANTSGSSGSSSGGGTGVTILSQQVVGPYATVQLSSTNANALDAWLMANGYVIPSAVQPVIAAYVAEGFDFLAMRLLPGTGVQAMRPVSVTSTGAGLSLPLRMVAAGTGATVGITLWVVSTGRYEPMNFPMFTLLATDLVWDWTAGSSNYTTLRAQKEAALKNAAWQIESSLDLSPVQVENSILNNATGGGFGSSGGTSGARPADQDYLSIPASDAGVAQTADQVRTQDLATLFPSGAGSVRITRMRGDLSHAALANDLVLQASQDQTPLSNVYQVGKSTNVPACPQCPSCGGSSTGGSSGIGIGSSGGSGDGGAGSGTSPGQESFGCSTAPTGPSEDGFALALGGLLGVSLIRARARNKR